MKTELNDRIKVIDAYLDELLEIKDNPQKEIYEAMRYSVFAGGKRLRPVLMWECAKLFDGDWEDIKPFAAAMEMIHTYSLIHDDLPAMDNDDLRRGMPTNHIKFGEDTAILAGDALLNKAFETVSDNPTKNPELVLKAISVLASSSGSEGMIGGQIVDIASEGKRITLDELRYIHLNKTGALIRSACVIGALLAGASQNEIKTIDNFAINLGVAFQIQDDILDVIGNSEELGKPIGSDGELNKNTYVSLLGIERSKELVREYSNAAKKALSEYGIKSEFLMNLTDYLIERTS